MLFSSPIGEPEASSDYGSWAPKPASGEPRCTVGLFNSQIPRELLYAMGFTPVRIFPTVSRPTAAEAYLPRNFCALNRLILASFLEDDGPAVDAVIFADEDDAARRLHDVWLANVNVPVWAFVEVPRAATALAISRYARVLSHTARELEALTGRPLVRDALRQAIALYSEQRDLLARLKRHWLNGSLDTNSYRRLRRTALTRDPKTANGQLRSTLEDLSDSARSEPSSPRLLLLAELAAPAGLVRLVEAHGGRVMAEDSDLDERELAEPVSADAESVDGLLAALARAYLLKPAGPRVRDMQLRLRYLTHLVQERAVQAAICAYSKFCDLYLTEYPTLKAHLNDLGVPAILLELEDDDVSGQHRTRVEAFLEMIG